MASPSNVINRDALDASVEAKAIRLRPRPAVHDSGITLIRFLESVHTPKGLEMKDFFYGFYRAS